MTIKQKVDKYLKDNYGDVVFETKIKGFRWQTIADKIGKDINKDVVKDRWKVVKKKIEIENTKLTSKVIVQNEEIAWKVIEKNTIETANKQQKQPWSFITFLKNLFKKL
jgi:hypothetical protein